MKVAMLTLCLLAPAGKPTPAIAAISPTMGGIKAEIRDASGAPISGVEIRLKDREGRVWVAITDTKGRFQAGGLPPGDYEMASLRAGFEGEVHPIKIRGNAWLLGVAQGPVNPRLRKGRHMLFFGPPIYETSALGLKVSPKAELEKIPMH